MVDLHLACSYSTILMMSITIKNDNLTAKVTTVINFDVYVFKFEGKLCIQNM